MNRWWEGMNTEYDQILGQCVRVAKIVNGRLVGSSYGDLVSVAALENEYQQKLRRREKLKETVIKVLRGERVGCTVLVNPETVTDEILDGIREASFGLEKVELTPDDTQYDWAKGHRQMGSMEVTPRSMMTDWYIP